MNVKHASINNGLHMTFRISDRLNITIRTQYNNVCTTWIPEAVDEEAVVVLLAVLPLLLLLLGPGLPLSDVSVTAVSSAILSATTLPAVDSPNSWGSGGAGVQVPSLATITLTVVSVSNSTLLSSSSCLWCRWWSVLMAVLSMSTDLAARVSITDSVRALVDSSSMSMSCLMSMMIWWCLVPDAPEDVCTCTCVSGTWWWWWWWCWDDRSRLSRGLASLEAFVYLIVDRGWRSHRRHRRL